MGAVAARPDRFRAQRVASQHGFLATIELANQFDHAPLKDLLELWRLKRNGRPMPRRSDITLRDVRAHVGHIAVVDIIADPHLGRRYKLRLVGDSFSNTTGHRAAQYVDEASDKGYGAVTTAVLDELFVHPCPLRFIGTPPRHDLEHVYAESLLAPLSDDGSEPQQIMIATWFSASPTGLSATTAT